MNDTDWFLYVIELSDCGGNKMDANNILKEILEGESAK